MTERRHACRFWGAWGFRGLALAATALCFVVVVLGAYVRLNAAGLGCPDWPGCYGHLSAGEAARNVDAVNEAFPHRPFEYHKAAKEMVHRYFASTLGILILILAVWALANRKDPEQPVVLPCILVGLVILQGLLGMWTVTLLLKPLIVTLHLLGGMTTLALLGWLALEPPVATSSPIDPSTLSLSGEKTPSERASGTSISTLRRLTIVGLIVLGLQIALGGWTSSNYAAVACPDFPTCQNRWWPNADFKDAFVLWRGLGIDYEGGVLDHPARVAIHFTHRFGAVVTTLILAAFATLAVVRGLGRRVRWAGGAVLAALALQLAIGVEMVWKAFPLPVATAHNAGAALLLLAVVALLRRLTDSREP